MAVPFTEADAPPAQAPSGALGEAVVARTAAGPLLLLTTAHFLVDFVAGGLNPLWPALEKSLHLSHGALLHGPGFILWTLAASFSQLLFGCLGDRWAARWLIWAGPLLAVFCLSSVGLVDSVAGLALLLACGGLGIAAFHPEAAVAAAACAPHERSRAMSVFAVGGYLGQALGPYYSGWVVDRWGLSGLAWGMGVGAAAVAALAWTLRRPRHATRAAPRQSLPWRDVLRGRRRGLALIFTISALRVVAAGGLPLALAYGLEAQGRSNAEIGWVQSCFFGGIGLGALACASFVRRSAERRVLWSVPLLVAPLLYAAPHCTGAWFVASVAACGLLLGLTLPVIISQGQQLLPQGQRVASSLTMGVSWGLGGILAARLIDSLQHRGQLPLAYTVFAAATLVSAALVAALPAAAAEPAEPAAA